MSRVIFFLRSLSKILHIMICTYNMYLPPERFSVVLTPSPTPQLNSNKNIIQNHPLPQRSGNVFSASFLRVKIIISGHTARVRTRRNHGSLSALYNIKLTTIERSRRIPHIGITFSIGKDDADGLRLRRGSTNRRLNSFEEKKKRSTNIIKKKNYKKL